MSALRIAPAVTALACLVPASLEAQQSPPDRSRAQLKTGAAGLALAADLFRSSDAEDTDVLRLGFNFDWTHKDQKKYRGLRVERVRFNPLGQGWQSSNRFYVRAADRAGEWNWTGQIGTDGHTIIGAANVHNDDRYRKEFFIERDIIETPQGLTRKIYHTFAGAAFDVPLDDRNSFALVAGLQEFTGKNIRTHLRGNYIHVVQPDWGLSAHVRTRWFHSSSPGEYDYYSPRWYVQILPLVQVRRFTGKGWQFLAAGGVGIQRDSASKWRPSRYLHAQVTSPRQQGWAATGSVLYSNTPVSTGMTYRYVQISAGVNRSF